MDYIELKEKYNELQSQYQEAVREIQRLKAENHYLEVNLAEYKEYYDLASEHFQKEVRKIVEQNRQSEF